jgi:trehalose 6-phosphate phosphatase
MLPSALEHIHEIVRRSDRLAVFLDYDGTLTPIVSHPEDAWLADSTRQTLRALATLVPVAILTGRDLDDVRRRVDTDGITYAGSHGFDIAGPNGLRKQMATEFLPDLDAAEKELHQALVGVPGARVERKRFSIAAHYRNVDEANIAKVKRAMSEVAERHGELRRVHSKKVCELLPDIDWNKGKAVLWLLGTPGLEHGNVWPIYIGDDRTDEDAFGAIENCGIGILVSEQPKITAATYLLKNPDEVERFLQRITDRLRATEL